MGNLEADENDTLRLNVGGARVICQRSTLMLFPDSKLTKMFCDRWDKKILRDKQHCIFLDVNPAYFKLILNYLTFCATSSPLDHRVFVADIHLSRTGTNVRHTVFFVRCIDCRH